VVSKYKLKERASMGEVSIIGVDLAKTVFEIHVAGADGRTCSGGSRRGGDSPGSWRSRRRVLLLWRRASASWISVAFVPIDASNVGGDEQNQ
jgi:hypothetical protein